MTTATPTPAAPLVPIAPTPRRATDGPPLCWKRTQTVWATVPAPWSDEQPGAWMCGQHKRLVFDSGVGREGDLNNPRLRVFAIGGVDPSEAGAFLLGELSGMEYRPGFYDDSPEWYFLCDWPALPRLVSEVSPLLRFHEPFIANEQIEDAVSRLSDARNALLGTVAVQAPCDQ